MPTNSDVAATNTMWTFDQLVDVRSGTGGLEVYFVNKIVSDGRRGNTVGLFTADGIAIARAGTGVTLAYEVGHAFGMEDVYSDKVNGDELRGFSCSARLPDDWSGGAAGNGSAGARYYRSGRRQTDIVKSMLMNGCTKSSSTGIDVSYGMVSVTVRCSARPTIARRATAEGRNIAILHLSI